MARPKEKPLLARVPKKKTNSAGPEAELSEDDSWVIVKKQIVRILVPPLKANKQHILLNSEATESQAMPTELSSSVIPVPNQETSFQKHIQKQPPSPKEVCLKINTTNQIEKPFLLVPKLDIPTARRSPRPVMTIQKLPKKDEHPQKHTVKHHRMPTLLNRSKESKQVLSFLSRSMILNQRMRASILEKKLRKTGGLNRWLSSMGLDRFITIFQRKNIGKFQLANMSMEKLKDMGVYAVGPRRKLIHTINCLCEPSCFRMM